MMLTMAGARKASFSKWTLSETDCCNFLQLTHVVARGMYKSKTLEKPMKFTPHAIQYHGDERRSRAWRVESTLQLHYAHRKACRDRFELLYRIYATSTAKPCFVLVVHYTCIKCFETPLPGPSGKGQEKWLVILESQAFTSAMMNLQNKICLVAGASRGIGRGIARPWQAPGSDRVHHWQDFRTLQQSSRILVCEAVIK